MEYKWVCNLKKLMKDKGVTQRDLSADTGIATSTLSRLYNNYFNRVDVPTLNTLAAYFEIESGDELFECVIEQKEK